MGILYQSLSVNSFHKVITFKNYVLTTNDANIIFLYKWNCKLNIHTFELIRILSFNMFLTRSFHA